MSYDTLQTWDFRFLKLAEHIASWSKDPSTKVGAVIVNHERVVVGLGYNGFPRGVRDAPERLMDRDQKLRYTVHAEVNAILNASAPVAGCSMYLWPFGPCAGCAKVVIQAGIMRLVHPENKLERWKEDMDAATAMLREACTEVIFSD